MKKILWGLMTLLAIGVAFYGWGMVFGGIESDFIAHHFAERPLATFLHFFFGPLALAIGGFQFLASVRARWPILHRWVGRIYVISCLLSGTGGFLMALTSTAGPVAQIGFLGLAIAWFWTTIAAYRAIRAQRVPAHKDWMIRSFALTYGAVTLRIYLGVTMGPMGLDFMEVYPIIAWAAWVPNLLFVEWLFIRRRRRPAAVAV